MTSQTPLQVCAGILTHPHRERILAQFTRTHATLSPRELAGRLDLDLGVLSYHVRTLQRKQAIRLVKTEPRRGAVEHYYELTDTGRLALKVARFMERQGR